MFVLYNSYIGVTSNEDIINPNNVITNLYAGNFIIMKTGPSFHQYKHEIDIMLEDFENANWNCEIIGQVIEPATLRQYIINLGISESDSEDMKPDINLKFKLEEKPEEKIEKPKNLKTQKNMKILMIIIYIILFIFLIIYLIII